jgi:hypothetical protein
MIGHSGDCRIPFTFFSRQANGGHEQSNSIPTFVSRKQFSQLPGVPG